MPGRIHTHAGKKVYHRRDGALKFHGRNHSRYSPERDAKLTAANRPKKSGYAHAGDGKLNHKGKDRNIHRGVKRRSLK